MGLGPLGALRSRCGFALVIMNGGHFGGRSKLFGVAKL